MNTPDGRVLLEDAGLAFYAVCWSPDGSQLAVGDDEGKVRVLSRDGRVIWERQEHEAGVYITWSPDGRRLATGSVDHTCRLWDANSGQVQLRVDGRHQVLGVAWSPDSKSVVFEDDDIQLVDANTGERCATIEVGGQTLCVAWSPDSRLLACGTSEGGLYLFDATTYREMADLEGHEDGVRAVAFSPDSRWLASSSYDRAVRLWDVDRQTCVQVCRGHSASVRRVAWSPRGRFLVSGSDDQTLRIWSKDSGEERACLEGHSMAVQDVVWSPDGTTVASGSADGTLRLWDVTELGERPEEDAPSSELATYLQRQSATMGRRPRWAPTVVDSWVPDLPPDGVRGCIGVLERGYEPEISRDGRRLFVGSKGQMRCVRLETGDELWTSGIGGTCWDISLSNAQDRVGVGSNDNAVYILDARTGALLVKCEGHRNSVCGVAWSPDDRILISAAWAGDDNIRVWDTTDGACLRQWAAHQGRDILRIRWSPDGRWVASCGDDGIRVWDSEKWEEVSRFDVGAQWVHWLAWSPDGTRLIARSARNTKDVCIWGLNGDLRATLRGHVKDVLGVSWSPDGRWVASASSDRTIRVWDAESGKEAERFESLDEFNALAWSPSGGFLVSGQDEVSGRIRLWDVRHLGGVTQSPEPLVEDADVTLETRRLSTAQTRLHGIDIHAPVSLVDELLSLIGGALTQLENGVVPTQKTSRWLRELAGLRWPRDARLGLVALILHKLPRDERWKPPSDVNLESLRDALALALSGEPIEPEIPALSESRLIEGFEQFDDRLLSLLTLLGPQAVAADLALPIRMLPQVGELPAMSASQRKLLGLRVSFSRTQGRSSGRSADADRARVGGIEIGRLGESGRSFGDLLPSQWALSEDVLIARQLRGELLFRSREVSEPPRLRPTVILLDTSAAVYGAIESVIRPAAHAVACSLRRAGVPCVLVTTGGGVGGRDRIVPLEHSSDLVAIWTHRTLDFPEAPRVLRLASALRSNLEERSGVEPIILLLTHPWFCAEDEPPRVAGLRGLFVQYPGREVSASLAPRCERARSVGVGELRGLESVMGELVG